MSTAGPRKDIAVAIVCRDDQLLVGTRQPEQELHGYSEFPGGKVEPGESPERAAVRECLEETGIEVAVQRLLLQCDHDYPHAALRLSFFHATAVGPSRDPRPPFRWVDRQSLDGLRFPAANRRLLRLLAKQLSDI